MSLLPPCQMPQTQRVASPRLVRFSPWDGQGYPLLACECITLALLLVVFCALCSSLFVDSHFIANLSWSSWNLKAICPGVETANQPDRAPGAHCLDTSIPGREAQPTCQGIAELKNLVSCRIHSEFHGNSCFKGWNRYLWHKMRFVFCFLEPAVKRNWSRLCLVEDEKVMELFSCERPKVAYLNFGRAVKSGPGPGFGR